MLTFAVPWLFVAKILYPLVLDVLGKLMCPVLTVMIMVRSLNVVVVRSTNDGLCMVVEPSDIPLVLVVITACTFVRL